MKFETKIVDLAAQELWGLKLETTMETAQEDCPKLWEKFVNYLTILNEKKIQLETSYGISVAENNIDNFTYWAATPKTANLKFDEKLEKIILTQGLYLSLKVDSLENIFLAYHYAYETWPKENETFKLDYARSAAELYEANYFLTGELILLIPINE